MKTTQQQLIARFNEFWRRPDDSTRSVIRELLDTFKARAAGCWRREGDELVCLEFVAADDMPIDIQHGFLDVMQRVSMSRVELGCVRAAAEMRPVIAQDDAAQRGLSGSASWLERFEAGQSLAIPILRNGAVLGVLAIATVEPFDESSDVWQTMNLLVMAISQAAS